MKTDYSGVIEHVDLKAKPGAMWLIATRTTISGAEGGVGIFEMTPNAARAFAHAVIVTANEADRLAGEMLR